MPGYRRSRQLPVTVIGEAPITQNFNHYKGSLIVSRARKHTETGNSDGSFGKFSPAAILEKLASAMSQVESE